MTTHARSAALNRRAFLAFGGAVAASLAAGCSAVEDLVGDDADEPSQEAPEASDDRLVSAALADQERVLAYCLAMRTRHRQLRKTLGPIVDHHRTHVEILGGEPSNQRAQRRVPTNQTRALKQLRTIERAAANRREADSTRARSGELARVLAAIAASQSQHIYLLDQALREA